MPWRETVAASRSSVKPPSPWLCMSMKPGASASPCWSSTVSPAFGSRCGATAAIRSPSMRTSPRNGSLPVPS